jgi:tRNA-2-methylthio-N6-dimethylallyladenosine synthase
MNRNYTREKYLKIIAKIKKVRPDMALATDIIVGFPGETKKQFADTISLYKKCDFDMSYNAMYSPRTGTAAFRAFTDDVSREEKRRRWLVLQKLMEKNALRKNKKFVGKFVEVLVDGCSDGKCWGFSREYKRVVFSAGKSLVGEVVNVKINKVKEWELEGEKRY